MSGRIFSASPFDFQTRDRRERRLLHRRVRVVEERGDRLEPALRVGGLARGERGHPEREPEALGHRGISAVEHLVERAPRGDLGGGEPAVEASEIPAPGRRERERGAELLAEEREHRPHPSPRSSSGRARAAAHCLPRDRPSRRARRAGAAARARPRRDTARRCTSRRASRAPAPPRPRPGGPGRGARRRGSSRAPRERPPRRGPSRTAPAPRRGDRGGSGRAARAPRASSSPRSRRRRHSGDRRGPRPASSTRARPPAREVPRASTAESPGSANAPPLRAGIASASAARALTFAEGPASRSTRRAAPSAVSSRPSASSWATRIASTCSAASTSSSRAVSRALASAGSGSQESPSSPAAKAAIERTSGFASPRTAAIVSAVEAAWIRASASRARTRTCGSGAVVTSFWSDPPPRLRWSSSPWIRASGPDVAPGPPTVRQPEEARIRTASHDTRGRTRTPRV